MASKNSDSPFQALCYRPHPLRETPTTDRTMLTLPSPIRPILITTTLNDLLYIEVVESNQEHSSTDPLADRAFHYRHNLLDNSQGHSGTYIETLDIPKCVTNADLFEQILGIIKAIFDLTHPPEGLEEERLPNKEKRLPQGY